MNRLQIALHGFESLAPGLNIHLNAGLSDRVEQWLSTEVCPVVEQLGSSRKFQSAALWSVNHFAPSTKTDERKLVEKVEQRLINLAAGLSTFITVARQEAPHGDSTVIQFAQLHEKTAAYVANKPWIDLVCILDFFGPTRDLHLDSVKLDHEHTQAFRNRNVQLPLGDYVTRLLLHRVDYWVKTLLRIVDGAISLVPGGLGTSERFKAWNFIKTRRFELCEAVEELVSICNEPTRQKQRDAAAALTLIYSAYAANPQLAWLGADESCWKVGGKILRSWVRRRGTVQILERDPSGVVLLTPPVQESLSDPSVIRHIAYSLQEMKNFFDDFDDPKDVIAESVELATLVMVDRERREVWFNGTLACDAVWDKHEKSWDFLWKLAINPGHIVDHEALSSCSLKTFRSRRSRLGELLGEESRLNAIIENQPGLGYQLKLEKDAVILLKDDGFGNLKEFSQSANRLAF
jgi:hypothetical protein